MAIHKKRINNVKLVCKENIKPKKQHIFSRINKLLKRIKRCCDNRVFIILSSITLVAIFYCSDLQGPFRCILTNNHDSLWYGICQSIMAAYIFYIIQIYIPECKKSMNAYSVVSPIVKELVYYADEVIFLIDNRVDFNCNKIEYKAEPFYIARYEHGKPWGKCNNVSKESVLKMTRILDFYIDKIETVAIYSSCKRRSNISFCTRFS